MEENPLTLTLGSNILHLEASTGQWVSHSSDLEEAEGEIDALIEERGELLSALDVAQENAVKLKEELLTAARTKSVVMEMLGEEREKRLALETELEAYKTELRKSYKAIMELRKMAAGPGVHST